MDKIHISEIDIHPVKGLSPQTVQTTEVCAGFGLSWDRAFALMYADAFESDPRKAEVGRALDWVSKSQIATQVEWPELAALKCSFSPEKISLNVKRPDASKDHIFQLNHPEHWQLADEFFSSYLKGITPSPALRSEGHAEKRELILIGNMKNPGAPFNPQSPRFPDRKKHDLSIINLASVKALGEMAHCSINPRAFRGNIYLSGLEAWEEFSWVGKTIKINDITICIDAPIARCFNINVDPDDGSFNTAILEYLARSPARSKCGVVASIKSSPSQGATLTCGDLVTIL